MKKLLLGLALAGSLASADFIGTSVGAGMWHQNIGGYAKNGILLIDEIETAIHHSLLIDFTKFIQQLADEFNVQVFLTSHSKECIDAFLKNNYNNKEISAYYLENKDGKIKYKYSDGERLYRLIENMDIDIRGTK